MTPTNKSFSYSLYCDESGMFTSIDTHVICPLIVANKAMTIKQASALWSRNYQGNWEKFHACQVNKKERLWTLAMAMTQGFLNTQGVSIAYVHHETRKDYGFDFHLLMLFHLMLRFFNEALADTHFLDEARAGNKPWINLKLHAAERGIFDSLSFQKQLHEQMKGPLQALLSQNSLGPDAARFDTDVYYLPAAANPFLQASDLFSHLVRARLKGAVLPSGIEEVLAGLSNWKIKVEELCGRGQREINSLFRGIRPASPPQQLPETVTRKSVPPAEVIVQLIQNAGDKDLAPAKLDSLEERFLKQPCPRRIIEYGYLLERACDLIRTAREYSAGKHLTIVINAMIEKERNLNELTPELLNELFLKNADFFLTASNHLGVFAADEPMIREAWVLSKHMRDEMRHWLSICTFHNHLAVAHHNVFGFDQTITDLYSLVEYFENIQNNPFASKGVKAREIGALFGTYAQSLAFSCHCRYFTEGNTALTDLDNAELYSELAAEQFGEPSDIRQQALYRIHFKLQRYILADDKTYLENAGKLLYGDDPQSARPMELAEFISLLPDVRAMIPGYGIAAALKHAWLAGISPEWFPQLITSITTNRDRLPAQHPMEQILAYTALISGRNNDGQGESFLCLLKQMPFSGIVRFISRLLLLQIEYSRQGKISQAELTSTLEEVPENIRKNWQKYNLTGVLNEYLTASQNRQIGPMSVLPFNYS